MHGAVPSPEPCRLRSFPFALQRDLAAVPGGQLELVFRYLYDFRVHAFPLDIVKRLDESKRGVVQSKLRTACKIPVREVTPDSGTTRIVRVYL